MALRFAYDGTRFASYARQPSGDTVEDALLAALRGEGYVEGSWRAGSRTDRGVSALENMAVVKLDRPHIKGLVPALDARLPDGVWVTGAARVAADWNPRHAASRTYTYVAAKSGERLEAMAAAAARFQGTHDMTGFARIEPERSPTRTVDRFTVADDGRGWRFEVTGPSFLWNQVRRMVAAVLEAGTGRMSADDIERALQSGEAIAGLAPAEGLLLSQVRYDPPVAWDPVAGTLPRPGPRRAWEAARVRAAVADHVASIASA